MKKFIVESVAHTNNVSIFYYASFYPYAKNGEPQIFVTIGDIYVVIAACGTDPTGQDQSIDIIATYEDENPEESLCSVCWTYDTTTGRPWIAVGGKSGIVKIIDCASGNLVRTLKGHGDEILDLNTCPTHPYIIASTSGDHTIRIWNLDPNYKDQPCAIICAGEGHREQVLTVAFHDSGRFLVSGGMDNQVHLWALPDFSTLQMHKDDPIVLHWSHFSTNALHSNYVDSVAFYGDLILSKAAKENKIVLWRIDGFKSEMADILSQDNAPTNHDKQRETISAFGPGFTRLVQFSIPNTAPWYMRFGKLTGADNVSPLLAMGNDAARVYIFDLQGFELRKDALCNKSAEEINANVETESTKSSVKMENAADKTQHHDEEEDQRDASGSLSEHAKKKRKHGVQPWSAAKDLARRNQRVIRFHRDKNRWMAVKVQNGAALSMSEDGSVATNEDEDGQENYLEANSNVDESADDVDMRDQPNGEEDRSPGDQDDDEDEEDEVYDDAPDHHGFTKSTSQPFADPSNKPLMQDIQIFQVSDDDSEVDGNSDGEADETDESDQGPVDRSDLQDCNTINHSQSIISNTDGGIIELSSDSSEEEEAESHPMTRPDLVVSHSAEADAGVDDEDEFDDEEEEEENEEAFEDQEDAGVNESHAAKQPTSIEAYVVSAWKTVENFLGDMYPDEVKTPAVTDTVDEAYVAQNDKRVKGDKRPDVSLDIQTAETLTLPSSQQKALSIVSSSSVQSKTPMIMGDGTSVIADPFQSIRPQIMLDIPRSRRLVRHLAFSPHGEYLVAVGDGGVICVWRME
ncbi:WD40-repeat-containing domain protein [Lipomyces tetrasporus]